MTPASDEADQAVRQFIAAVRKKQDPARAAAPLGKVTKDDVMRWADENELDLLHHVIILNHPESLDYLLKHGYFQVCIPLASDYLIKNTKTSRRIVRILKYLRKNIFVWLGFYIFD